MALRTSTNPALPQIKPASLRIFHARLAAWYETHGRHSLPWRQTDDPYAIWISEVMLQQTQVATVLARFYHPFLTRFPTIEALAEAPREAVMKAWEGLGYYSRARNLHLAAQQLQDALKQTRRNKARLPDHYDALLALPGIGRNTAHAILAFGHHRPVAIMEANVKRIVARIFALAVPTDQELWAGAAQLLNMRAPFDYNQAMMDLGAAVCTPKAPGCNRCPANGICAGQNAPESYPLKRAKKAVPVRLLTITVTQDPAGRYYLEPRADKLLGGLYGFPQQPRTGRLKNTLGAVTHVYSHFRLEGEVVHLRRRPKKGETHWYSRAEIAKLPLSGVDHKVLALIDNSHTRGKKTSKSNASAAMD